MAHEDAKRACSLDISDPQLERHSEVLLAKIKKIQSQEKGLYRSLGDGVSAGGLGGARQNVDKKLSCDKELEKPMVEKKVLGNGKRSGWEGIFEYLVLAFPIIVTGLIFLFMQSEGVED